MIALSWVLLAAAIASLIYGLTREGLTFIYVSIGASVGAMLFLLAGILRKRPVQPATAGAPYGPPAGPEAHRPAVTGPVPSEADTRPISPPPAQAPAATGPGRKTATKKPAARKAPSRKKAATAKKTAAAEPSPSPGTVVALPERGTYHETGCRFVRGKPDTERLSIATAKRRGYNPCGVCKPGSRV